MSEFDKMRAEMMLIAFEHCFEPLTFAVLPGLHSSFGKKPLEYYNTYLMGVFNPLTA